MGTHNLCFRAKIRKLYPCKSQFYCIKVGVRGCSLHGLVFVMEFRPNVFLSICAHRLTYHIQIDHAQRLEHSPTMRTICLNITYAVKYPKCFVNLLARCKH